MKLPTDLISGNYIKPRIFLCEVDKERICQLETTNTSAALKFNSYSELSFEVGRIYNDVVSGDTLVNPHYDKIEALRLIEIDGLGYFEIQGPELISDGIKEAKNVTAYSLEYTLSTKYLSNFIVNTGAHGSVEVTYAESLGDINNIKPVTLYNQSNHDLSLLHLALKEVYGWKIGHVDASLQTLSRSFEVDRVSVYDFLMNEVCEKFNCYIVFDTINNTINIYAESLTAKFIGDGKTNVFTISPPFSQVGTVSVGGYKTTRWNYNSATGAITLEDVPVSGSHIEIVDGALTEWETDVFVSFDNLSQEINVNYDADSIKTKLTVTYGDDGDIREVNLGLPYLTDISYYYTVEWMGQDLYDAYTAYMQKSNDAQSSYTNNSQEILKLNDKIYYEKTRLSLEYSLVQSVGPTTVGTYYVRQENSDGSFYYKEVSLPSEYNANEQYYSNATTNVNEEKMSNLYEVLKKYFNNENKDDNSGNTPITSWKTELNKLSDDFEFMETYTIDYLSTELSKVGSNRIGNATVETAINNFLAEVWSELGKIPLEELYLKPYQEVKETNIKAGWAQKDSKKYGYYYPVLLYIASIEKAIANIDVIIKSYEQQRAAFEKNNANISSSLIMDENFTESQLIRLSAFLREDELNIEDIVETSQDDLSSSFKVKQDAMESGRIELQKLCQPQLQFSMTMANIYALPEFEPIIDQFQLGKVIKVALRPDYIKQSRLMQVNINFDDFSDFSCEFGELTSLRSQSDIHADLLKNAITAGKSVATNSSHWTRGSDAATSIDLKIQQGLLDSTTQIKAMDGSQGTVIDKWGIHLRDVDPVTGEVDPKQGWIVNNQFLYSDDGFKTTKAVFGEYNYDGNSYYGVLADALIGRLIIGTQLEIGNSAGTLKFDDYGLSVTNGINSFKVDPNSEKLLSISDATEDILYVDKNGMLCVKGRITARSGKIGGLEIGNTSLSYEYTDPSSGVTRSIYVQGYGLDDSIAFAACHKSNDDTNYTYDFYVRNDGYLYANNARIKGHITATSLSLEGCKVSTDNISGLDIYISKDGTVGSTPSSSTTGFKVSSDGLLTASNAVIYGTIYSSKGKIAGWNIVSDLISNKTYNEDENVTYHTFIQSSSNPAYNAFAVRKADGDWTEKDPEYSKWNYQFAVDHTGYLLAKNANIQGSITATSGSIGGWTIDHIHNDKSIIGLYRSGVDGCGIGMCAAPSGSMAIWAGYTGGTTTPYTFKGSSDDLKKKTAFYVTGDGQLIASNADITGTITSTSGSIGGWTIASWGLSKTANGKTTGIQEPGTGKYAIAVGSSSSSDWSSAPFRVTHAGEMYSTSGTIGNWTISSDRLTCTAGDYVVNIVNSGSATDSNGVPSDVFTVYNKSTGGWPFYIRKDGYMKCTNADIKGTLNTGSSIGSGVWRVSGDWLSAKTGSGTMTEIPAGSTVALGAAGIVVNPNASNQKTVLWNGITSDRSLKDNINFLINSDDKYENFFNALKPAHFNYNTVIPNGSTDAVHYGFVAQDILDSEINNGIQTSSLVGTFQYDKTHEYYYVQYEEIIPLNTWQIQKAKTRITELEARIEKLEKLLEQKGEI